MKRVAVVLVFIFISWGSLASDTGKLTTAVTLPASDCDPDELGYCTFFYKRAGISIYSTPSTAARVVGRSMDRGTIEGKPSADGKWIHLYGHGEARWVMRDDLFSTSDFKLVTSCRPVKRMSWELGDSVGAASFTSDGKGEISLADAEVSVRVYYLDGLVEIAPDEPGKASWLFGELDPDNQRFKLWTESVTEIEYSKSTDGCKIYPVTK